MKFNSLLIILVMAMMLVSGCSFSKSVISEDKSLLEKNLKSVLANARKNDSGALTLNLKGDVKIKDGAELNLVKLDTDIKANYRLADKVTRVRDLFLDLIINYSSDDNEGKIAANLKFLDNNLYVLLSNVPSNFANLSQLSLLKEQWIKLTLPAEIQNTPGLDSILKSSNLSGLSEEELALKELYFSTSFYKEILDNGSKTRNGKKVKSYSVIYDSKAIYDFYIQSAEISGKAMSEKEKLDLKPLIEGLDLRMTYFILENKLVALEGKIDLDFKREDSELELNANFVIDLLDTVDESKFQVPSDAIDLMQMFGNFN